MKKIRFSHILIILLLALKASAQLPSDFRSEQIFLCPKQTAWLAKDTIDVEGQVTCLAEDRLLPYSNYVYVELIDSRDSVLVRQKVSCKESGYFVARIPQDPTADAGVYYLRAYTNLMRNFSASGFAVQPILVGQNFPSQKTNIDEDVECKVIPAGGVLVPNSIQSVTAYLTDYMGHALAGQKLSLVNAKNDTIAEARTSLSGIADLKFMPQNGVKYRIAFSSKNVSKSFDLPPIDASAKKIQASLNGEKLYYEVLNCGGSLADCRLYVYNRELGIKPIKLEKNSGIITLAQPSRFTTLFLTDASNNILSEYSVCRKTKLQPLSLANDTLRAGAPIAIGLPETLDGSKMMLRVLPENSLWAAHAESALMYESDLSSPIPFPEELFSEAESQRNNDLQSWLNTATFKRFSLKEAMSKGESMYTFMPETTLNFVGKVEDENNYAIKKGSIVAYNTENNLVYDTTLDAKGRFQIAVDDFDDGTSFFLQTVNNRNKPISANISLDDATYPPVSFAHTTLKQSKYADDAITSIEGTFHDQTLPDVVVKARVRKEKPKPTNKFYSTNYADREEIEKHNYLTLLDILKQMPGLIYKTKDDLLPSGKDKNLIEKKTGYNEEESEDDSPEIAFYSTRGVGTLKAHPLPLVVDGVKIDGEMAINTLYMPAADIEEVELLRPWQTLQYVNGAIDGAIMVKTRNSARSVPVASKGTYYTPLGLSPSSPKQNETVCAPADAGNYHLLVDVVSPSGIHSFEKHVVVTE